MADELVGSLGTPELPPPLLIVHSWSVGSYSRTGA